MVQSSSQQQLCGAGFNILLLDNTSVLDIYSISDRSASEVSVSQGKVNFFNCIPHVSAYRLFGTVQHAVASSAEEPAIASG